MRISDKTQNSGWTGWKKVESPKEVAKLEPVAEPKQPSKVVEKTIENAAEKVPEINAVKLEPAVKPVPAVEVAATPVKPKRWWPPVKLPETV